MNVAEGSDLPTNQLSKSIPMIYIVGNSYCGSTLLGFLLGSNPNIIFLGEFKIKTWLRERSCSCGQSIETCQFYGQYFDAFNEMKKNIFAEVRPESLVSLLYNSDSIISKNAIAKLEELYHSINKEVLKLYPEALYIVDSSKSIWMLNAWLHTSVKKDIRIIWLKRPLKPNLASFLKRGNKFIPSLSSLLVNNVLIKKYLKKNHLDYLELNYDDFYKGYGKVASSLSSFLQMEIPPEYINQRNHHVISGNSFTRKTFTEQFKGFHKDEEWKTILNSVQKKILSWID